MADFYAYYPVPVNAGGGGSGTVTSVGTGNGLTGGPITTSGTVSLIAPVVIANGGTNSIAALNNNRVMKSAGGAIVEAAAITAARALISDANGIPTQSVTTDTELGYVNGVTSSIQDQLDAKEPTLTPGDITTSSSSLTIGNGSASTVGPDVTVDITTGALTAAGTDGIAVTGGTGAVVGAGTSIAQHVADSTHNGYLSSSDWSTFNGKQGAGNYITALTGDVTASGPGSAAATVIALTPVGSIVAYHPGYYTAAANSGFTLVGPATNTVAGVNAFLPANWRVCDGTALNDAGSPIWVGANRFLPNLTDSRFTQGSTTAGGTGGENANSHTHSVTSSVTVATQPTFTVDSHTHSAPAHYHALGTGADLNIAASGSHNHGFTTAGVGGVTSNSAGGANPVRFFVSTNATGGADADTAFAQSGFAISNATHTHVTGNFAGRVGLVTGGVDGNAAMTSGIASVNTTTRTASVALTNNAVTSGAPSDTENRPLYLAAFYIVRVK
jgi:hypothetical protein